MTIRFARRILLCLRYGIGDLVMEMPAIAALRRAAPEAHITALGARPAIELLDGDPRVDARACVQDFGFDHWGDRGSAAARARFRDWYRAGRFDLVLDPSHAVSGIGAVLWEEPLPEMRDAGQALQSEALRLGMRGAQAVRHAVQRGWGLALDEAPPQLHLDPDALCFAQVLLAGHAAAGAPVAALSPAASSPLKRWPVERLAEAGRHLAARGWHLLLLCAPGEEAQARALLERLPCGKLTCAGPLHLRQVAALLSLSRVLLCNDTGLMHVAAAVGTTPFAVFGPTSPDIYRPENGVALGGRDPACHCRRVTEFGPPTCVAAGRCLHGEGRCIDQVGVDEMIAALDRRFGAGA